ncbi:GNAT family N-acetyltransferase [Hyphomicrobium sp. NDB2Meth4]|uniref:GNAT family N-acetyltransferase n=1 Tax=Hyphomicrobium sp. NDB2Meth4 TaxID=1892846 RepID=UPI0009313385|nr:GNAT family N-acetyltransferase [Hyphomicrobium sp. NDB2Meth4]
MGRFDDIGLVIRPMQPADLFIAADWAAAEGWNPGLGDMPCFASIDPQGFLVGEHEGRRAAIISNVNYSDGFAFLGFYIVRPELRGRGFGWRIWQAALQHSRSRVVGLDGVVAQQDNYRKSGFKLAWRNARYGGVPALGAFRDETVPLSDIPIEAVATDDAALFPADRAAFVQAWVDAPGHVGRAIVRDGELLGWGVIRPSRKGRKIAPLYAKDREVAETLFSVLAASGEGEVFIDVPEPNAEAAALALSRGLAPCFETARMYTGPVRPAAMDRIFGITSYEVG